MIVFNDTKQKDKIIRQRQKSEENLVKNLAKKYQIGYVDLSAVSIDTDALKIIPEEKAKESQIAAFDLTDRKIALGVISPFPEKVQEEIKKLKEKKYEVRLFMISQKSLQKAWSRYGDISYAVKTKKGVIDIASDDILKVLNEIKTLKQAQSLILETLKSNQSYRISKVIELILFSSYSLKASDIHFEPEEKDVLIRFRLDGILTNVVRVDTKTYNRVLNRIKLTAGLKINLRSNAQDGRFSIKMVDSDLEIRTSVIPNAYGESIVLRLLDPNAISVSIDDLGMLPYFLKIMKENIEKPNGIVLNTGPTGSGKSTTLFAFLQKIRKPGIKILTIEDPIEYHLKGVIQTQVDKEKGYTFFSGLKAALRQDPDVIMIGEIRDKETALTAFDAALTGHLVLSTLHTNSAAGTFSRILDLGVNPQVVSSAINLIIAQRLVRKLCSHCKKKLNINSSKNIEKRKKMKEVFATIENKEKYIDDPLKPKVIYEPTTSGCKHCNKTGYKGRVGIYEAIYMDKALEELLKTNPNERDITEGTKHQGILSLKQDGLVKILNGITSFDELDRVIDL